MCHILDDRLLGDLAFSVVALFFQGSHILQVNVDKTVSQFLVIFYIILLHDLFNIPYLKFYFLQLLTTDNPKPSPKAHSLGSEYFVKALSLPNEFLTPTCPFAISTSSTLPPVELLMAIAHWQSFPMQFLRQAIISHITHSTKHELQVPRT